MKNQKKQWLPHGANMEHFLRDIVRVWPSPGVEGLQLLQIGVSVPLGDVKEPFVPTAPAAASTEGIRQQSDIQVCYIPVKSSPVGLVCSEMYMKKLHKCYNVDE